MGSGLSRRNSARNFYERKTSNPKRTKSVPGNLEGLSNGRNTNKINGLIKVSKSSDHIIEEEEPPGAEFWVEDIKKIMIQDEDKKVSISSLFNIMVQETWNSKMDIHSADFLLLIDCRSKEDFLKSRIATAIHHSDLTDLNELNISNYIVVVLYGNSIDCVTANKLSEEFTNKEIDHFSLSAPFSEFRKTYPVLCTDQTIKTEEQRHKFFKLYPSVVIPGKIYQGNADEALDGDILSILGITHVVNVTLEHPNKFKDKIKYLRIQLDDKPDSDLKSWLKITSKFIHDALSENFKDNTAASNKVLVHCNMGRSRSSTVVLGYMMDTLKWPLKQASSWLKDCRPTVIPNNGFILQLLTYEKEVFGHQMSDLNDIPF